MSQRLLTVAVALLVVASCGEEFSPSETTSNGGSSTVAASSSATTSQGGAAPMCDGFGDACTDCTAAECAKYACRCFENPSCLGIYDCYGDVCPGGIDAPCSKYCFAMNAAGISLAVLWGNCSVTLCATECSAMMGTPLTPCEECLYDTCAGAMNDCLSSAACFDYLACASACGNDPTCVNDCGTTFSEALPLATAVQQCSMQACPNCN